MWLSGVHTRYVIDGPTDRPTERVAFRVAFTRLESVLRNVSRIFCLIENPGRRDRISALISQQRLMDDNNNECICICIWYYLIQSVCLIPGNIVIFSSCLTNFWAGGKNVRVHVSQLKLTHGITWRIGNFCDIWHPLNFSFFGIFSFQYLIACKSNIWICHDMIWHEMGTWKSYHSPS